MRLLKIATRSVKEKLNPVVTHEGSYVVSSEGFRLTTRLLEEFYCATLQHESLPVIIIFPDLGDFSRYSSHQAKRYEPLLEHLHTKGFRVLDMLDALVTYDPALPKDRLTVGKWGHYSRLGNSIVAIVHPKLHHQREIGGKRSRQDSRSRSLRDTTIAVRTTP